jgi:asparagine synthase (glutamine-hydrolysing)
MCGIVGTYPEEDAESIGRGLAMLGHRGPDEQGIAVIPAGTFGHSRLAILDVANGQQPMAEQDSWIVFNGEIYNYRDLRDQIDGEATTDSDTEVILKLYREYGPEAVSMLDGMFAFAISDSNGLFLARDPLGIKPLYWSLHNDRLYFASEIKSLAWLTSDIQEFPPGYYWHSSSGFHKYSQLEKAHPPIILDAERRPSDDALKLIQDALREAVQKRLIADDLVDVGVSLSGGLDSSIVAALACEGRDRLDTFVVGTPESEDIEASQQVADYLGTQHHRYIYTFEEMLAALPEVIYHLESFDAALIRSSIPNYFLARLAADHVKVILTGEGADELFAGYAYLRPFTDPGSLHRELWVITSSLHNTNLQRADRMSMAFGLEARVPFLDENMVDMVFNLPPEWKMQESDWPEKELLRRSVAELLPDNIVRRPKQKFSDGAGSINLLTEHANETISDAAFEQERRVSDDVVLRSKEELLYYRVFDEMFGDRVPPEVIGRTRSITRGELN